MNTHIRIAITNKCIKNNAFYYVDCKYGPQWHHVKVLKGRNPLDQTASVILVQDTPG